MHFYSTCFLKGDSHVGSSEAMRISDLQSFHPVSPSSVHGSPVLESSLLRQLMCTAPEKRGTALTINPNKAVLSINCTTLQVGTPILWIIELFKWLFIDVIYFARFWIQMNMPVSCLSVDTVIWSARSWLLS